MGIKLAEKYNLEVSQFRGQKVKNSRAGHILQIFIKRHLLDKLTYAAMPYGPIDHKRMPLSKWINSDESVQVGQARIVAHPQYFLKASAVRMFVASADPVFHNNRHDFQRDLTGLLRSILDDAKVREAAASGIYGGALPSWWTPEAQDTS